MVLGLVPMLLRYVMMALRRTRGAGPETAGMRIGFYSRKSVDQDQYWTTSQLTVTDVDAQKERERKRIGARESEYLVPILFPSR